MGEGTPLGYPQPDLSDDLVRLRPWTMDDLGCIEQASRDSEIRRGTTVPSAYTLEEGRGFVVRQWARQVDGVGLSVAISDVASGGAVGLIALLRRDTPMTVGVGYWVLPEQRRQGRATRAIRLLSRWAIEQAGMARVDARVMPDNEPSLRALRNCGFVSEGILRSHLYLEGRHHDMVSLSLIAGDLERG